MLMKGEEIKSKEKEKRYLKGKPLLNITVIVKDSELCGLTKIMFYDSFKEY